MAVLNLLTGTRRLRRDIELKAQQLERDIEHEKLARAQLQQTFMTRVTSPVSLLSAAAAGFIAGKVAARPSHPKRLGRRAIGSIAALTLSTARSIGLQVVLPLAIEWIQSKFAKHENKEEPVAETQTQDDTSQP